MSDDRKRRKAEQNRTRYHNDPEFRAKRLESSHRQVESGYFRRPDVKERRAQRYKERYENDPEFRERRRQHSKDWKKS